MVAVTSVMKSSRTLTVVLVLVAVGLAYYAYNMYRGIEGFADGTAGAADELYFVYATWCPHCKGILPAMKELESKGVMDVAGKKIRVILVESEEKDKIRALPIKVEGFPTLFLKKLDGSVHEYHGERSVPALLEFVKSA